MLAGVASERSAGLPLLIAIAVFSALAVYFFVAMAASPALRATARAAAPAARAAAPGPAGTPLRFPAWVGMFASYVVSGMVATVFPLFAQDVLGASKGLIGALISSRTLTQSLGFLVLGLLAFWHDRKLFLVATQAYLALLLVLMIFARSLPFFAVLFPLLGLATAMSYAGGLFHGIAGAGNRAGRMASHESVLNGGYIVGASVSGVLYQEYSMRSVVLFCLGTSLVAMLAQGVLLTRRGAQRGARPEGGW